MNINRTDLADELCELGVRLRRKDPTLTHFQPFQSTAGLPFTFQLLEHDRMQSALNECLEACREAGNDTVRRVTLSGLPEPELSHALEQVTGLVGMEELRVSGNSKSQSIPISSLVRLLVLHPQRRRPRQVALADGCVNGLRRLEIETRIVISKQGQIAALAKALSAQRQLQSLSLKLLPRCSIRDPELDMDAVVAACASLPQLRHLRISLGYEHNPYGQPMVRATTVRDLLDRRREKDISSALKHVELDNFGLTDEHLMAVAKQVQRNDRLKRLYLTRHPAVGLRGLKALHDVLQDKNYTLQRAVLSSTSSQNDQYMMLIMMDAAAASGSTSDATGVRPNPVLQLQRDIEMLANLNRWGRKRLLQGDVGGAVGAGDWVDCIHRAGTVVRDHGDAATHAASVGAIFSLLLSNPSLCQSRREDSSCSPTEAVVRFPLRRKRGHAPGHQLLSPVAGTNGRDKLALTSDSPLWAKARGSDGRAELSLRGTSVGSGSKSPCRRRKRFPARLMLPAETCCLGNALFN